MMIWLVAMISDENEWGCDELTAMFFFNEMDAVIMLLTSMILKNEWGNYPLTAMILKIERGNYNYVLILLRKMQQSTILKKTFSPDPVPPEHRGTMGNPVSTLSLDGLRQVTGRHDLAHSVLSSAMSITIHQLIRG